MRMKVKSKIFVASLISTIGLVSIAGAAFADDGGSNGNQQGYGYGYGYGNQQGYGYGNQQGYGFGGQTLLPPQVPGNQNNQVSVTLSPGWNLVDAAVNASLMQSGQQTISDYWNGQSYSANATGPVNGIWIYSQNGGTVTMTTSQMNNLSMRIAAKSWGMIGNPYPTSQTVTLQAGDVAYTYDPSTNQYSSAFTGTLTLQPGQGAWLFSSNGGSYSIGYQPPAPPSTVTGSVYNTSS